MGEVYLAEDTSLNRLVALKFLPPHMQQNPTALKRFIREAESAAALEHPYICNIKEISRTEDGQQFLVMEYVEGKTLGEKLKEGPIPVDEGIRIGVEVAEALELAHGRGIVHRDLKPANIMITPQGHAKVMDFGLAKRVGGSEEEGQEITTALTQEGATLGTLSYMSPEQLNGASRVDARSDIFSFGIVLYEMLTGIHPFRRGQPMETASAILTSDPQPPGKRRKDIPEVLGQTILKMLARNPEERFQSIHEVSLHLSDPEAPWVEKRQAGSSVRFPGTIAILVVIFAVAFLSWWTLWKRESGTEPKITSIAVLPLINLSGDPEQEFFADGMTEALITDLSKIGALKVIARKSVMGFKNTDLSLDEIAAELNVEAIIEGSVLREGNRVGITAQLIEAATGQNLWADRFDRNLTSLLALHAEIAQSIAREVQVTLTPGEEALLSRNRKVNPEALDAFLKGQSHWYRLTPGDLETALQYFELAKEKDPGYALAYVGISLVWVGRQQMGITPALEAAPRAREAALKAIELDDSLAEAHYNLALVRTWTDWDWEAGEESFLRAIELNPNYADARAYYSHFLMIMDRKEEALTQMERAMELDPFNPLFQALNGVLLFCSFDLQDKAIEQFQNALRTEPNHPVALTGLIEIFRRKGMYKEAFEAAKTYYASLLGDSVAEIMENGYREGGFPEAMNKLAELLEAYSNSQPVPSIECFALYAYAGKMDKSLEWLERAFEEHDPNIPYVGTWYGSLVSSADSRQQKRFLNILNQMNLPDTKIKSYMQNGQEEP